MQRIIFYQTLPFSDMMWYNAVKDAKGVNIYGTSKN